MSRVVTALLSLIVGLICTGFQAEAFAASAMSASYTYDGNDSTARLADRATERRPPSTNDQSTTYKRRRPLVVRRFGIVGRTHTPRRDHLRRPDRTRAGRAGLRDKKPTDKSFWDRF